MRRLGEVLREQYGEKVYKLSLSSGCSCPNRDGSIGTGGCSFCSEGGSGDFAAAFAPIGQQLEEAGARERSFDSPDGQSQERRTLPARRDARSG